jgi:fatty acid desaturase
MPAASRKCGRESSLRAGPARTQSSHLHDVPRRHVRIQFSIFIATISVTAFHAGASAFGRLTAAFGPRWTLRIGAAACLGAAFVAVRFLGKNIMNATQRAI